MASWMRCMRASVVIRGSLRCTSISGGFHSAAAAAATASAAHSSNSSLLPRSQSSCRASSHSFPRGAGALWGSQARHLFLEASSDQVILNSLPGSDAGIMVLALNRPEAKNAIGIDMLKQLQSAVERLQHDPAARVVLVCSIAPGVFCAGADLKERRKMGVLEAQKFVSSLRATFSSVEVLSLPTIAVIEGVALGGGLELALACDLRVCGADATFGLPETSLGIIPGAGGTQRLPRLIGRSRAKELIFTGRRINADDAESLGLVEYSTGGGEAYEKALEIARKIIQQGPLAIKMAKVAIDRGTEVDASSGMVIEEACYGQVLQSKDRLEGLAAFAEKRRPVYHGE